MRKIRIVAAGISVEAALYEDNSTADAIWEALPLTGDGMRWGEEVYFGIPVELPQASDARDVLEAGELGYWPVGKAFCIFWGATPASLGDEIRAYSPVNVFGRLEGDPSAFDAAPSGSEYSIERAEET
jgi:hypothetical protein